MVEKKNRLSTNELILSTYEETCEKVKEFFAYFTSEPNTQAYSMEGILANADLVDALIYTYNDVAFDFNGKQTTVFDFLTSFAKDKYTWGGKGYTINTLEGEKTYSVHTNVFATLRRLRRLGKMLKNRESAQDIDAYAVEEKWGINLGNGFKPVKWFDVDEKNGEKNSEVLELQDHWGRTFYLWKKEKEGETKYGLFDGVGRCTSFLSRDCINLSDEEMNFCFANVNKDNIFNSAHITPVFNDFPLPNKKGFSQEQQGYFVSIGERAKNALGAEGMQATLVGAEQPMVPIRQWACGTRGATCTLNGGCVRQNKDGTIKFEIETGKKAIFKLPCGTPYTIVPAKEEGKYLFSWKNPMTGKEYTLVQDEQQVLLRMAKYISFFQNKFEEHEASSNAIDVQGLTIDYENNSVVIDPNHENPTIFIGDKEYPVKSIRGGKIFQLQGINGTFSQSALCKFIEKQKNSSSFQDDIIRVQEGIQQEKKDFSLRRFVWQAKKDSRTGNYVLMLPRDENTPQGLRVRADSMILSGVSVDQDTGKITLGENATLRIGKGQFKKYRGRDIPLVLSEFYYQQDNRALTQQKQTNATEFLAFFKQGGRS